MFSKITVIHESNDFIVIDKPAGIVVTPGPGHSFEQTVAGWLLQYVGESLRNVGIEYRWGVVHRLDKQTSGLMVCAKTPDMYEHLVHQFRERLVSKEYKTLVWGDVLTTLSHKMKHKIGIRSDDYNNLQEFVVNAPIARHPKGISTFVIDPSGKPASTQFVLKGVGEITIKKEKFTISLLNALPKTGRTHQIRVHAKAFGHPVLGDSTYQTKRQNILASYIIQRQFLHAAKLSFTNFDKQTVTFESTLPKELKICLEKASIKE